MKRNLCAKQRLAICIAALLLITLSGSVLPQTAGAQTYTGKASYYGPGFHGRKCANGEVFDMYKLTCAHKTLPFGTRLKVTNLSNGKSTVVRVTDRGPYAKGRILDLSKAAAMEIDMIAAGVATVSIEVITDEDDQLPHRPCIIYEPDLSEEFKFEVPKMNITTEWARSFF